MGDFSQYCPCCQHSYGWIEEGSEVLPTELTCHHTLCSSCVKSQWIDIGDSDDTVYCFTCSKRVGILSLKKFPEQENTTIVASSDNNLADSSHLVLTEKIKKEKSEDSTHVGNENDSAVTSDPKDILLQEWVNSNVSENYIFRLVTTGTEPNNISNTYILDNGLMVQTDTQEPGVDLNHGMAEDTSVEKVSTDTGFPSATDGVTLQSNMIGSPDLNLKALLQMLEKSSENSLGCASAEMCDLNQDIAMANCNNQNNVEAVNCSSYMLNVPTNSHADINRVGMTEKILCEQIEVENPWRPVIQQSAYIPSQEKLPQSNHCSMYRNVLPYAEKNNGIPINCLGTQSTALHEVGEMTGDNWLTQRGVSQKSNPRSKRGRKKKPLFRHFQSEFFMRPYLKRENSPQLQLVKLVRQKAQEKKAEEVKAAEAIMVNNENKHSAMEGEKGTLEDPELAFMKTVDMPSGKRVEDIYVVPPVWISNEKQNMSKLNCNKEPHQAHLPHGGSGMYSCFPMQAPQRIPVQVYSHGSRNSLYYSGAHNSYIKHYPGYAQHHSTSLSSHPVQIPTLRTLHTSNDNFKPNQNMYKVIKGHIITTLNAPKIGPVPTLREICKAVLGMQAHSSSDPSYDNLYSYANGHHPFKFTNQKIKTVLEDACPEIKSPKEFLDIKSGATHQELKLPESRVETVPRKEVSCEDGFLKEMTSQKDLNSQPSFGSHTDNFSCLDDNNISDIYDSRLADKFSDSEETLSENPLVPEDLKQIDRTKTSLTTGSACETQALASKGKIGMQYYDPLVDVSVGRKQGMTNFKESLKCMYARNIPSGLTNNNTDYVIPIVSYKLKEPIKNTYMSNTKPEVRQQECVFTKSDNYKNYNTHTYTAPVHQPSFYPNCFDQQVHDDASDQSVPSLIGLAKQIKWLSSIEPLNKQLANLANTMNMLSNAEKTLFESNLAMFRQMKTENESKLGHLSLCIRKLGDSIVSIGWTLQRWSKPTSNRCFKTMGALTDLYNSNIMGLAELITPYFHYVCELIASNHSNRMNWNKHTGFTNDQMNCLTEPTQREPTLWHELNLASGGGFPKTMPSFTYEENSKSSSPKEFTRQDNDQSLSSEDFMDRESEASNSGQTSAKTSPRIKVLVNSKRGRPLGSKNGQRKSKGQHLKGKPKRRFNTISSVDHLNSLPDYQNATGSCQSKMLMPNTILVNMSSESFWNDAHATMLGQGQNPVHLSHPGDNAGHMNTHSKLMSDSGTTPWGLQGGDKSHLSISPETSDGALNLLDQAYQSNLEAPDLMNGSTSLDTSAESSPVKKTKLEDKELDGNHLGLVYQLSQNANLLLQHSSMEDQCTPGLDNKNRGEASTDDYQNIFYIKTENSDDELQLDNPIFTGDLIKDSKNVQEKYQITFLQDCPTGGLDPDVKTLMTGSIYSGGTDHTKLGSHLTADLANDMDDFSTHPDPNDSMGTLCHGEANMNDNLMSLCVSDQVDGDNLNLCPSDVFGMSSSDNNSMLHSSTFDEHLG
ncbi:uncharacterized protein LOC106071776 [Biomphalaria glabrata]|uniref:Uncharacterized protein LOC106071776 n=1 Tax=Biomphalaria glabrata TaxID=6526 RepID=A0A9U8EH41_BIOGL|nr:uncharacterized protein LOC106071776 [Biomphalaria glabrata]KAI8738667.1 hypothetical protein BgiBS90_035581 [Biomphalaria glabrata]